MNFLTRNLIQLGGKKFYNLEGDILQKSNKLEVKGGTVELLYGDNKYIFTNICKKTVKKFEDKCPSTP